MKKHVSALALAALLAAPAAQAATKVDIGGDMKITAYTVDFNDLDAESQSVQNRIRLKVHFTTDDGIQVNTRWALTDRSWNGDDTGLYGPNGIQYAGGGQYLDYGYVQLPVAGWTVRLGRQESNWAFDLISSDDRRDRITLMRKFGAHTILAIWDKRTEGGTGTYNGLTHLTNLEGRGTADREAWTLANVSVTNGWLWGVLAQYYTEENAAGRDAGLDGALLISPMVQGKIGGVQLTAGAGVFVSDGEDLYADGTPISAFIRAGYDFGGVKIEGQYGGTRDGGLVSGGFDTFSSLLNNSPTNNRNPLSVYKALGSGNGAEDWEEDLLALRVTGNVTDKVKLVGSVGWFQVDNGRSGAARFDEDGHFYELQAHYQLAKSTSVVATVARGNLEDVIGTDVTAGAINIVTNF